MKKIIMISVLSIGTLLSTTTIVRAHCGIDCWLSNTFSSNDFVGNWLKDSFGGINNSDTGGSGNKELIVSYERANKAASIWKSGKGLINKESKYKPICKLQKLLDVVNKERSPEALIKKCFMEERKERK